MKFNALIDSVHFDTKKRVVMIVLIGASHVSLDALTTLTPKDEPVQVTLESSQTTIDELTSNSEVREERKDTPVIDEEGAAWLKEVAQNMGDASEEEEAGEGSGD